MKKTVYLLLAIFLAQGILTSKAYAEKPISSDESVIYSVFIYHFTKYVKWPESSRYQSGDFVIGVLGNTPLMAELEKMAATKKVDDRSIKIVKYSTPDEIGKDVCHILYLPEGKSDLFDDVQKKTRYNSTLIVTHKEDLGKAGSQINFVVREGKPRFEMNENALFERNLKYVSTLRSLAIMI
ncbi:protein of unknown function [Catalinimonas alkaloidigena]|uniref:YfiR family protein n=1 Tax=Catalinimonas alkaloidigena TaxID=1075417 RepID=A0A1G8WMT7_9BACT|nr:YfiR family protein [Catalinimonas alkaloidigena]SDJ79397.1 protein of unknown function [Catalinimonas alkaloidigena]